MASAVRWILDFEGYQIHSFFYPIEIGLLSLQNNDLCYEWRIKYESVAFSNRTTRWQHNQHALGWKHGNKDLHVALTEIRKVINDYNNDSELPTMTSPQHIIYVKGFEKANWIKRWFQDSCNIIVEQIHGAPSFRDLSMFYGAMYACIYHRDAFHLRCARKKVYQLLPYCTTTEFDDNSIATTTAAVQKLCIDSCQ